MKSQIWYIISFSPSQNCYFMLGLVSSALTTVQYVLRIRRCICLYGKDKEENCVSL